nr:RNA-directed DNA polymerase, eukaryota, reverse transcriptase zinc-binding domain protein [Tanacetum cinerariifolium]
MPFGRLVDDFIANKRSKGGKRFGFIRFLGIKDANEFVRSLSNIWIGNFHLYVAVALFQRGNASVSQTVNRPQAKNENPKTDSIPKPEDNPKFPYHQSYTTKPSFADVLHNKQKPTSTSNTPDTVRSINLNDNDLITIEDPSTVLLLKLKEADTLSNMYAICKNKGSMDLSIHHVGGLWIWIQFFSKLSCSKFGENANMKRLYSSSRNPAPYFKVDERMIWIKISGLPLCAWGSNAYKNVASLFRKFKFLEDEESTGMSLGRVCISTRSYKQVSETIKVEVNGEIFDVYVQEIGTWNINIDVNTSDTSSHSDVNHLDKDDISVEDKLDDDLDDLHGMLNDLNQNDKKEDILCKQEEDIMLNDLNQMKKRGDSIGGLISMSDPNMFSKDSIWCDDHFIIIKGHWNNAVGDCFVINIYGPQGSSAKSHLWNRIAEFMNEHNGKYILFGDMITVQHENERPGSFFSRTEADHFNSFINFTGLIDLPMGGHYFTWMNKAGTKLSKLDRFLISVGILEDILDIKNTTIDRMWSNHSPILLHVKKSDFGPSPFKSYNSWLNMDGFDVLVKSMWASMDTRDGNSNIKSHEKLREINDIERKIDDGSASVVDREKRISLLQDIDKLDKLETINLIQKAHIKWDIEGDENSKFFDGMINCKRRSQAITGILHDGVWISDPSLIKEVFLSYYKDKFQDHDSHVAFSPMNNSSTLNPMESEFLEPQISLEEVKNVVWDCGSNKALVETSWIRAYLHSSRASILINGLHCVISNGVSCGLIRGIKLGSSDITLSHFFYADDVVITTDWNSRDIDNIIRSLSSWKADLLSIGGHLTLIKAMLGSLGIYYLSIFKAPEAILNTLEILRSRFFWGGSQDTKHMAWVKWSHILPSFDKGGLNIGSLKAFNLALLQKWRWRMVSFPNSLWVNSIRALHGQDGGLDNQGCRFNGIWSRIIGTSNFLHSKDIIPLNSFRFKVGCGTHIHFWKDIWIGDSPLLTRYNRLYTLEQDKDYLIIDRQIDISVDANTCTWSLADDGIFSVRSSRRLIDDNLLPSTLPSTSWDNILPHKGVWFLVRKWCDLSASSFASYIDWKNWLSSWQISNAKSRCLYVIVAAFSGGYGDICFRWETLMKDRAYLKECKRGLALGSALMVYGREEQADTLIEERKKIKSVVYTTSIWVYSQVRLRVSGFDIDVDEFTLSSLDVLQGFSFFLQMGLTLILATLDGLDVGLLGDVIGEDDCVMMVENVFVNCWFLVKKNHICGSGNVDGRY